MNIIDRHGGEAHFVHVSCSQEELEQRVIREDRKTAGKIDSVELLLRQQRAKNHQVIPGSCSLEVDNTDLQPGMVADKIVNHFNLLQKS